MVGERFLDGLLQVATPRLKAAISKKRLRKGSSLVTVIM
jgi:hypothetical protein